MFAQQGSVCAGFHIHLGVEYRPDQGTQIGAEESRDHGFGDQAALRIDLSGGDDADAVNAGIGLCQGIDQGLDILKIRDRAVFR